MKSLLRFLVISVFILGIPLSVFSQLSVTQVIDQVLQKNPSLLESRSRVENAKGALVESGGIFNTSYAARFNKFQNKTPLTFYTPLEVENANGFNYSLEATKKLPWGTTITPSLGVTQPGVSEYFPDYGDVLLARGTGSVQLTQPVLGGSGKKYNTAAISQARNNVSKAECQYYFQASVVLLQSLDAYLQYIESYQSLTIQSLTEQNLKKVLSEVTHMVELDALPASELLVLQANLSTQVASRLIAENNFSDSRNTLGALMGLSESEISALSKPDTLFPVTGVKTNPDSLYGSFWTEKPLTTRYDIQSRELDIQSSELEAFVEKKNTLPKINVSLTTGYNGVSGGYKEQYYQSLYQNIPGMNYGAGISINFGGRNELYKGRLMQTRAEQDILKQQKSFLELDARNQIKNAWNKYRYTYDIVGYLNESVKNYAKAFLNETRKFQAGISTSLNVVEMQSNYLTAKNQLVSQQMNLNMAVLEFRHQTGTLIEVQADRSILVDPVKIFTLPEKK